MRSFLWVTVPSLLLASSVSLGAVVVVPNANATVGGNAQTPAPFSGYGSSGSHDQVLYPSSQFVAFGGAQSISRLSFRPYPGSSASAFTSGTFNISNVTISLSTSSRTETGANALSSTYAGNVGTDSKVVYSGPLTLTTSTTDTNGGATKVFDYTIPFQNNFTYDPSLGNLLLDVNIPVGATVSGPGFGFVTFDDVNTVGDGVASIVSTSGTVGTTGTYSTDGAIAQFTYAVPEPASVGIAGTGLVALLLRRKRR